MSEPGDASHGCDRDVVVVGGGPAGCSAAVFTARYGLDTLVFDRGRSSLKRCAYMENYLGFPHGVDVETLYSLMHEHVRYAGGEMESNLVESVRRRGDGEGLVVSTEDGGELSSRWVVAATRYDVDYLRALDDGGMYETYEYRGEEKEKFDRSYPENDGSTEVVGLYVASPAHEADRQAIMAAGRGARVGHEVVAEHRRSLGYPEEFADHYDWRRRQGELEEEWSSRDRWREWFEDRLPDDIDVEDDGLSELREREIYRRLDSYVEDSEMEKMAEEGQRRLVREMDPEVVVEVAEEIRESGELRQTAD